MSRSEAVRQDALARDGHRCVLCGFDGRDEGAVLHVHHVESLGMGGSDELDTLENCITLCADCHAEVHAASKTIAVWGAASASQSRRLEVQGAGPLEVLDIEKRRIPHDQLWFYRRKQAEELEPIEARIQCLHRIDGDVARDVWRLWSDDAWKALDPESRSWKEYCAARGWDTARATRLAKRCGTGKLLGIEWLPSETEAEYARRLAEAGDKPDRSFLYVFFRNAAQLQAMSADGAVRLVRCTDEDAIHVDGVGMRAGKLIHLRANGNDCESVDGIPIPVEILQLRVTVDAE